MNTTDKLYVCTGVFLGLLVILGTATEHEPSPLFMYIVGISLVMHSIKNWRD